MEGSKYFSENQSTSNTCLRDIVTALALLTGVVSLGIACYGIAKPEVIHYGKGYEGHNISKRWPSYNDIGGSTYIQWGKKKCSKSSTIYSGFAAGSHYKESGGMANYQCLPNQPEYSSTAIGEASLVYGAEYEQDLTKKIIGDVDNENVPCAMCHAEGRSAVMMMPARTTCPSSWTTEYTGYLMAGWYTHEKAQVAECVSEKPEVVPGRGGNENGALFYLQKTNCDSTGHCPPYIEDAVLTCVVCTK